MKVSRGTKCFSAFHGKDINGAFPKGFLKWLKDQKWLRGETCHLCSGRVEDGHSVTVDINPEMNPSMVADARKTGIPGDQFDTVTIDPPYTKELAQKLYKTGEHFHSINVFMKEAMRITRKGGHIITLSYEIPKKPKNADIIAVWGIYTIPHKSFMRCLAVFRKGDL